MPCDIGRRIGRYEWGGICDFCSRILGCRIVWIGERTTQRETIVVVHDE